MRPEWRPLETGDIDALIRIAAIVHPGYPEDDHVLAERLALYPEGCFLLTNGGEPLGYLLSHPWIYGTPPALNSPLGALPGRPTTYYLHDIALMPAAQGTGAAKTVIERVVAWAASGGFDNMSLCAVNGSAPFWTAQGFAEVNAPHLTEKLASYGNDVVFMRREL